MGRPVRDRGLKEAMWALGGRECAPVLRQAKIAKCCGGLHTLVAQVVDGEDAPRILHIYVTGSD